MKPGISLAMFSKVSDISFSVAMNAPSELIERRQALRSAEPALLRPGELLEDRADLGYDTLYQTLQGIIGKSYQTPGLAGVFSTFTVNVSVPDM